jgi:hypothetical protein
MLRRVLVAATVVLALLAATTSASSTTVSPCRQVSLPTWSPDGQQIAFYGRRWPPPSGHGDPNSILQALCIANADGTNVEPLPYTVCYSKCPDPPGPIVWLRSGILYLQDGAILRIAPGSRPKHIARWHDFSFVTNPAGTRIAGGGWPSCLSCSAAVTILDARSGAVVGTAGGRKLDNIDPSLSPDGTKVVFERDSSNGSGRTFGIWAARTNGSGLRQLAKVGEHALWSPANAEIAYTAVGGLRLVRATGGASTVLVPSNVENVFGWSPDGKSIAFETGEGSIGKLAVVDVATRSVRRLLQLSYAPTAVWSSDSSELLVNTVPSQRCWSTWRVPVTGAKPTLISSCR